MRPTNPLRGGGEAVRNPDSIAAISHIPRVTLNPENLEKIRAYNRRIYSLTRRRVLENQHRIYVRKVGHPVPYRPRSKPAWETESGVLAEEGTLG